MRSFDELNRDLNLCKSDLALFTFINEMLSFYLDNVSLDSSYSNVINDCRQLCNNCIEDSMDGFRIYSELLSGSNFQNNKIA